MTALPLSWREDTSSASTHRQTPSLLNILLLDLNIPMDNQSATASTARECHAGAHPVPADRHARPVRPAHPTRLPAPYAGGYVGGTVTAECAPFARALTGVRLNGDAADWWWEADGRYARSTPGRGQRAGAAPLRPAAQRPCRVVSQVLSERQILVTQANWVHHRVTQDQPVVDVSPGNDWSLVRVWWPPGGAMGVADYPAYGFIRPDRPATHRDLTAAVPRAIRIVGGG